MVVVVMPVVAVKRDRGLGIGAPRAGATPQASPERPEGADRETPRCRSVALTLNSNGDAPRGRMKTLLVIMTGIGFTLGVVFGLLLQLPSDSTLPAEPSSIYKNHNQKIQADLAGSSPFRSRRSLNDQEEKLQLQQQQEQLQQQYRQKSPNVHGGKAPDSGSRETSSNDLQTNESFKGKKFHTPDKQRPSASADNPVIGSVQEQARLNNGKVADSPHRPALSERRVDEHNVLEKAETWPEGKSGFGAGHDRANRPDLEGKSGRQSRVSGRNNKANATSGVVSVRLNLQKNNIKESESSDHQRGEGSHSLEDESYLNTVVKGIYWTPDMERSCPKSPDSEHVESWRRRSQNMDVVKMEEGCGRMQNRLVTFRDASKACARYRLNTDQIQGEIFSYYLARLLNVSNIPPTILVQVDSLGSKWRTVHLQLSLAQWADSKLVVLTQFIDNLSPAHIPFEFRGEGKVLEPTLDALGSKSRGEICELIQWSDLIIFDYLTANLDRVINNMFNRQWNDQMMASPAHNLEQRPDGSLVFLDNESGLFHGYRLLDKYANFHQSLLQSLCVFRPSTAEIIKRLHKYSSIGEELHSLFASNEVLHKHLAAIPEKNLKILQKRVDDVYKQIVRCERLFNR